MREIIFYCSHERPDVETINYQYELSSHTARGMEYAVCRHSVSPNELEIRDERVLAVARFLAENLASTLPTAEGADALKLVQIDQRSEKEKRIFGSDAPAIEWDFDILRFGHTPERYIRQEASRIIDLHAREGIERAELNGATLDFAPFERETVRARASRVNGGKGGRPQADPDRKLTRMGISIFEDQQNRLKGENISELIRTLLDEHIARLPLQDDWDKLSSL